MIFGIGKTASGELVAFNMPKRETRYHIVAINERTGAETQMTASPLTHSEACTMRSKFSSHPARRLQLKPVGEN